MPAKVLSGAPVFHALLKPRPADPVFVCGNCCETQLEGMSGMNPIDLIVTVCAVLSPTTCEETHLVFNWSGSLQQCAMRAPPYIAQWVGEHPKWNAVKWRCEYPHTNDKAGRIELTPVG
jgi:hypothetical protein